MGCFSKFSCYMRMVAYFYIMLYASTSFVVLSSLFIIGGDVLSLKKRSLTYPKYLCACKIFSNSSVIFIFTFLLKISFSSSELIYVAEILLCNVLRSIIGNWILKCLLVQRLLSNTSQQLFVRKQ